MREMPYMPLYISDIKADTAYLTAEEMGVYIRLLMLMWESSDSTLPADKNWLDRRLMLGGNLEALSYVLESFCTVKKGRIFQRRLKDEHEKIFSKIKARKKSGKKGGDTKALNLLENTSSKTTFLLDENSSKTPIYQNQNHINNKKNIQKKSDHNSDKSFQIFWKDYPRKVGKGSKPKAYKLWCELTEKHGHEKISVALANFAQTMRNERRKNEMIMMATTWLNDERWAEYAGPPPLLDTQAPKERADQFNENDQITEGW